MRRVKTYNLTTVRARFWPPRAATADTPHPPAMKLQPDKSHAPLVRAYDSGAIRIDDQIFEGSVIVSSLRGRAPQAWAPRQMADLLAQDLASLAALGAELVILGTGRQLVFPPASWLAPFAQQRVGLESMDTAAACRTYNILASEGRLVVAALLQEPETGLQAPL